MAEYTKQFAIISKIKSLVKKTGKTLFRPRKELNISEDVAKRIQKTAYELSHQQLKDTRTPTYIIIAEQLQVDDDQIFRAAVYSLANIARNEKKNAPAIIEILSKHELFENKSKEQIAYAKSKADEIKKFHKI